MIYKFIDENGNEISVNSLSSIKSLIESESIKEDTKIKAGLRGKWTTANKIEELKELFLKENIKIDDNQNVKEDIKDFILKKDSTAEETEENKENDQSILKKEEAVQVLPLEKSSNQKDTTKNIENLEEEVIENNKNEAENGIVEEETKQDYEGLTIIESVKTCFNKYFNFKDRASRSEFWFFVLFNLVIIIIFSVLGAKVNENFFWIVGVYSVSVYIPYLSVTARRLHDVGKTGWLQALPIPFSLFGGVVPGGGGTVLNLISMLFSLYLLILLMSIGEDGKNKYGDYPLKLKNK